MSTRKDDAAARMERQTARKKKWTFAMNFIAANYEDKGADYCAEHVGYKKAWVKRKAHSMRLRITPACKGRIMEEAIAKAKKTRQKNYTTGGAIANLNLNQFELMLLTNMGKNNG